MGQVLPGSRTATEAVRRAIQNSQARLRASARRYGIKEKAVVTWKKRTSVSDPPSMVTAGGDPGVIQAGLPRRAGPMAVHALLMACDSARTTKARKGWP